MHQLRESQWTVWWSRTLKTGEEISRLSIQSLEIKLRETTEELEQIKNGKMVNEHQYQPQEPNPLTFGKVLFMRDSDMDQKHANGIPFDSINLPERSFAESCIVSFFNLSNVQVPILHRDYYMYTYFKPLMVQWGKICGRGFEEHVDHLKYIETPVSVNHVDLKQKCFVFLHIIIAILTSQHQQKFPPHNFWPLQESGISSTWTTYGRKRIKTDRPEISKLWNIAVSLPTSPNTLMRPCHPGAWYLVERLFGCAKI